MPSDAALFVQEGSSEVCAPRNLVLSNGRTIDGQQVVLRRDCDYSPLTSCLSLYSSMSQHCCSCVVCKLDEEVGAVVWGAVASHQGEEQEKVHQPIMKRCVQVQPVQFVY